MQTVRNKNTTEPSPCVPEFLNSLSDYKQILECLRNYDGLISIQCENQIKKCVFYLGKVKNIEDEVVEFLGVGTDGKWDDKTDIILYTEITQISFGDNYSKMYYKYMY